MNIEAIREAAIEDGVDPHVVEKAIHDAVELSTF
jgi:hypothetical protein